MLEYICRVANYKSKFISMSISSSRLETFLNVFHNVILNLPPKSIYIRLDIIINIQKCTTIFAMFFFMIIFNNFQRGPIVYTAMHGIYGILWFAKHLAFPDAAFSQKVSLGSAICVGTVLAFYWSFGFLLCLGYGIQRPSGLRMFMAITTFIIGLIMMLCADAQKYYILKYKKGLISDGMFSRTRNPNYLGEMMLYSGLAICTGLWFSWIVLVTIWISLFAYRIGLKEFSLMKKEGYDEYKKRSGLLLPKFFRNSFVDWAFYAIMIGIGCYLYINRHIVTIKMISQYHH